MNIKLIINKLKTIKNKEKANKYLNEMAKKYPQIKINIYNWFEINNYIYTL